jgi:hypothetical protein
MIDDVLKKSKRNGTEGGSGGSSQYLLRTIELSR